MEADAMVLAKLMTRRGAASLTAGAILVIAGCGSGEPAALRALNANRPNLQRVDASLDTLASSHAKTATVSDDDPVGNAVAQQTQRDVDAILNAPKSRPVAAMADAEPQGLPSAPPLNLSASVPSAPTSNTGRMIQWNDPKSAKAASANPTSSDSLTPRQSSLFKPLHESEQLIKPAEPQSPATRPSLEPDRLKKLVVDLSRELYATGAYSEAPLRQLMTIAALSMIDPDRRLEPQAIPDLTDKERELLGKLQAFFADLGRSLDGKDNKEVEQSIVAAVGKLRESIVKQPQLKIATLALCTKVNGFGEYEPFDKRAFLAHNEQKAIVYLEVDDFTSELNSKGEYVTELSQQLAIYSDRDGIPVWKEDWQAAVDVTRNKRQDFFTVQVITLPKALSVGKYHLKVRARDEKSGAEAENSVEFEMVADPKMAASAASK